MAVRECFDVLLSVHSPDLPLITSASPPWWHQQMHRSSVNVACQAMSVLKIPVSKGTAVHSSSGWCRANLRPVANKVLSDRFQFEIAHPSLALFQGILCVPVEYCNLSASEKARLYITSNSCRRQQTARVACGRENLRNSYC